MILESNMTIKRNELSCLIQYYLFMIENYEGLITEFPSNAKYTKSLLSNNLDKLERIEQCLIKKDFETAEAIYNAELSLFDEQKNTVKTAIKYYSSNPEVEYPQGLAINLSAFNTLNNPHPTVSSQELETITQQLKYTNDNVFEFKEMINSSVTQVNDICERINQLSDKIDSSKLELSEQALISGISENINKTINSSTDQINAIKDQIIHEISEKINSSGSNFDFNVLNDELMKHLPKNVLTPVIVELNANLENKLQTLSNEMEGLTGVMKRTCEYYNHHETLSLNILDNAKKRIIDAQNKIIPNLDKTIGDSLEKELKGFFDAVNKQVHSNEKSILALNTSLAEAENKNKHRLFASAIVFCCVVVFTTLFTGLFVGKYQANKTVTAFVSLYEKNK